MTDGSPARQAIADTGNSVRVSAASALEITSKYRLGKLSGVALIVADLNAAISALGFIALPISLRHGQAAGALPGPHRDPFDWMLIAQAMQDNLVLVYNEQSFDIYGVSRLWYLHFTCSLTPPTSPAQSPPQGRRTLP